MSESLEDRTCETIIIQDINLDENKCSFRYTVEERLVNDPDHEFYGSMKSKCLHCEGYNKKCPGYMKRNINE